MISEKMTSKLNTQLNKEFYSAYLYLGMSTWCADIGYNGSASWFMAQYEEVSGAWKRDFKIYD